MKETCKSLMGTAVRVLLHRMIKIHDFSRLNLPPPFRYDAGEIRPFQADAIPLGRTFVLVIWPRRTQKKRSGRADSGDESTFVSLPNKPIALHFR